MKRTAVLLMSIVTLYTNIYAQEPKSVPFAWKWLDSKEAIFTYDGTFTDSTAFVVEARTGRRRTGVKAPEKYSSFPIKPEGAVNLTYSPDSTMLAYTKYNDLYVLEIATGKETRLTLDGSDLILNGYASWVYYEEIFGRISRYRAFWWSPDSRKIGFYRFDNSDVALFPIYSAKPAGETSSLQKKEELAVSSRTSFTSPKVTDLSIGGCVRETRYPKAGQDNPKVRIGMVDLGGLSSGDGPRTVWADFDENDDQYFGTPFWGPDSKEFFISRMPRLQNTLDMYSVSIADGSRKHIYHESYPTWIDWITDVVFTDRGLYMARNFETGWQQLYFLSYDGKEFRRLTDGSNWSMSVLRVDEKKGEVFFTAKRDASVRAALYKVDGKGVVTALTDPAYNVSGVSFSPDGRYFVAKYSNFTTPTRVAMFKTSGGLVSNGHGGDIASANMLKPSGKLDGLVVADSAPEGFDLSEYSIPQLVHMTTDDGFTLPGMIQYPYGFDPSLRYPVHVDIYGGPDAPMVRDRWSFPSDNNQWYSANGIIQITVDPRAAGHNGRAGLDMIYKRLTVNEIKDFVAWADWLKSLPYVDGDRIGVEGFSFGGTMTAMLLFQASDSYHFGIAGGGVYDWRLYDSHYTERYMDTPQNNPEGYSEGCAINYVSGYPVACQSGIGEGETVPVMLKITHGTGDDNVHFQNTLLLVDALQKEGKDFEFMIYPDGMHGYRSYQAKHFDEANRAFWVKYLLGR
ncbi:MAG: DPP IV N-terminal domain-containing protein [Candidatus Cryptobacteroides sp.]